MTPPKPSNRRCYWQLQLALLGQLIAIRARADNQVAYGYEFYQEDNDRMAIQTHTIYFEQKLADSLITKGELNYDGITGSTPRGVLDGNGNVKTTSCRDLRRSENIEFDWRLANHTLSPGFAHSQEDDYQSYGVSVGDAVDFNEKNTTLQYGVSQNFDEVRQSDDVTWLKKYATEGIISLSQLLSPKTIFDVAVTFGNDSGDLTDPYRQAGYTPTGFPFSVAVPERRPSHRNKEILFTSITQYFDSLNASLEASYRFYHDSYGVYANTIQVTWHQWLGKQFIVEPFIRGYEQSAADFYAVAFTAPYSANPDGFHSSDYRLSKFFSFDSGLLATAVINEHVHIVAGYHRYEMHGMDGQTNPGMYPKANVYTIGFSILW
jgi:hypothetical protein